MSLTGAPSGPGMAPSAAPSGPGMGLGTPSPQIPLNPPAVSRPTTPPLPRSATSTQSRPVIPTSAELELVSRISQLFEYAKAHRAPLRSQWDDNYRMLRNKYWDKSALPSWMPAPEVPEIWPIIRSIVGWLTDQRLKHVVSPAVVPNSNYFSEIQSVAEDLERVLDTTWHVNSEEQELGKCLWHAETWGTGFLKTAWDQSLANNLGDASIRAVSPYCIFPDPLGSSLDDINYLFEAKRLTVQTIDRLYPGAAELIAHGGDMDMFASAPTQLSEMGTNEGDIGLNPGALSPATIPNYGNFPNGSRLDARMGFHDRPVTLFECWIREHKVTIDEASGRKRAHDSWRLIVIARNRILFDAPVSTLYRHGQPPYARYVPADIGEFWGFSMVELLSPVQASINRILAALEHNIQLHGNPIWRDVGAGQQRSTMDNRPGLRVDARPDSGWIDPPQIHQAMPEVLRYMLQRMEAVSGLSAITRGGSTGRSAEGVVDAMQEAAFVSIRDQLKNVEYAMRRIGYMKASLIIDNYTDPRLVSLVGDDGSKSALALRRNHFFIPTSQGELPLKYQLLVDAGSSRNTSRKVREDQAMMLFRIGAIDEEALLEAMEFPNAQEVAERVRKAKATGILTPPGQRADR